MTAIEREIAAAVERSARRLAAFGVPVEEADLRQAGWVAALEALRTFDPARGNLGAYLAPILRATLGKAVSRWLHPASLSDGAARVSGAVERTDVEDLADERVTPEQLFAEVESRRRAHELIAEILAEMPARAAEIVACDMGAASSTVAARELGLEDSRVRHARRGFVARARMSAGLRALVG